MGIFSKVFNRDQRTELPARRPSFAVDTLGFVPERPGSQQDLRNHAVDYWVAAHGVPKGMELAPFRREFRDRFNPLDGSYTASKDREQIVNDLYVSTYPTHEINREDNGRLSMYDSPDRATNMILDSVIGVENARNDIANLAPGQQADVMRLTEDVANSVIRNSADYISTRGMEGGLDPARTTMLSRALTDLADTPDQKDILSQYDVYGMVLTVDDVTPHQEALYRTTKLNLRLERDLAKLAMQNTGELDSAIDQGYFADDRSSLRDFASLRYSPEETVDRLEKISTYFADESFDIADSVGIDPSPYGNDPIALVRQRSVNTARYQMIELAQMRGGSTLRDDPRWREIDHAFRDAGSVPVSLSVEDYEKGQKAVQPKSEYKPLFDKKTNGPDAPALNR